MKAKPVLFFMAFLLAAVFAEAHGAAGGICPKEPAFQKKTCEVYLEAIRLLEGRAEIYLLDPDTKTELRLYWGRGELVLERNYPGHPFFHRGYFFNLKSIISKPLLPFTTRTDNGAPHPKFEPRGPSETLKFSELEEVHELLKRSREIIPGKSTPL
ncbi:MAG: hypothetical protein Q8R12_04050 [bacterium]|nr:hypothetical protein [bacterium]